MKNWGQRLVNCFFVLLLSLAIFPSMGMANATAVSDQPHSHIENAKISMYVTVDQIIVSQEGIFVNLDSMGIIPVRNITWLQDGVCLILAYKDPQCGHPVYCPNCGGCNPHNRCSSRCKCPPRKLLNQQIIMQD